MGKYDYHDKEVVDIEVSIVGEIYHEINENASGITSINGDTTPAQQIVSANENANIKTKAGVTTVEVTDTSWRAFCVGLWPFDGDFVDACGAVINKSVIKSNTEALYHFSNDLLDATGNHSATMAAPDGSSIAYSDGRFIRGGLKINAPITSNKVLKLDKDFFSGAAHVTLDIWMRINLAATRNLQIATVNAASQWMYQFSSWTYSGEHAFAFNRSTTPTTLIAPLTNDDTWHLYSWDWDGTVVRFYVNGKYQPQYDHADSDAYPKLRFQNIISVDAMTEGAVVQQYLELSELRITLDALYKGKSFALPNVPYSLEATPVAWTGGRWDDLALEIPAGCGEIYYVTDENKYNITGVKFTIDFWLASFKTGDGTILEYKKNTAESVWSIARTGEANIAFLAGSTTVLEAAIVPDENNYHHYAITYNGNVLRFFCDGDLMSSAIWANATVTSASNMLYFTHQNDGDNIISDLRILKNYCQWAKNFAPPTGPWEL